MEIIAAIWNEVIIRPMANGLVVLYQVFFGSFGLSIIMFTIMVRGAMFPLTLRQSRQLKAMSALQSKLQEIRTKYPNDKQRVSQETMRLYKDHGVNPLGCLGPMVIQFPIFIGLYRSLQATLPSTPERLIDLSRYLYSWLPLVHEAVPLNPHFLGMDLSQISTKLGFGGWILAFLVGASMWATQKMTTMPSADPRQASTNRMMLWMMPIMFGYFTLFFQSGLALYWIVSNIVGIVIQGFVTGWEPLSSLSIFRRKGEPIGATAALAPAKEAVTDADLRDVSEDTRRGHRARPKGARRRARGGRNRRH